MNDVLLLLAGFVLLVVGGELLIRGSVSIAASLGMSKLLIGITLVGFGTSTPELVTSLQASFAGSPGIAIGNVVGSNISNILLIIGTSALIYPLAVSRRSLDRDGMVMLVSILAFALVAALLPYDHVVGAVFVAGLCAYLATAYVMEMRHMRANGGREHTAAYDVAVARSELARGEHAAAAIDGDMFPVDPADDRTAPYERAQAHDEASPIEEEVEIVEMAMPLAIGLAVAGFIGIILGGRFLVDGAVGIARTYGVSETVIGLTIVAVGTSMPELVTSVIAAIRKHSDVAVGNVLGSNIYNTLGIGGLVALIAPTKIPEEIIIYDNYVMIAATVALLLFAYSRGKIGRFEGALLLTAFVAYMYSLLPPGTL